MAVIDRVNELANSEPTAIVTTAATGNNKANPKATTIPQKKKAMVDLLKSLAAWGLSYHAATVMGVTNQILPLIPELSLHVPSSLLSAADVMVVFQSCSFNGEFYKCCQLMSSSNSNSNSNNNNNNNGGLLLALTQKAQGYFSKNVCEIQKMRTRAMQYHKDLSRGEITKSKGFVEHLFALSVQQRVEMWRFVQGRCGDLGCLEWTFSFLFLFFFVFVFF